MNDWWDIQIRRADELTNPSDQLMTFYAQLLRSQKEVYEYWRSRQELNLDLPRLCDSFRPLLETVERHGPQPLASEAKHLLESPSQVLADLLQEYRDSPTDVQFFGKACLQPYLKWVIESGGPVQRGLSGGCPSCSGRPQVSFLSGEGGTRNLICGSCLNSWEFRRSVCVNCGEERPTQLAYYHSPEFDHINIEACESCKHYLKRIDLTRNGNAAPLVDEIYAAPLDLWAREHGYTKIEMNLVGL